MVYKLAVNSKPQRSVFADVESSSAAYAARFAGAHGKWLLSVQTRAIGELLDMMRDGDSAPLKVLDVGGGHGQVAAPFARDGCEVAVLGSSEECAGQIAGLIAASRCSFMARDLLNNGLPDGAYKVVTCIRLLAHCPKWCELIGELCRLSNDAVIVDYPPLFSANFFYPLLFRVKKGLEGDTRPFFVFKHGEIEEQFRKHGFVLKERRKQFFWPMVLHRVLKSPLCSSLIEFPFKASGLTALCGSPCLALFVRN